MRASRKRRRPMVRSSRPRRRKQTDPVKVLLFVLLALLAGVIALLIYLYYSKKILF